MDFNAKIIPISCCIHRGIYKLNGRNINIGIYDWGKVGFYGLREKYDTLRIDFEKHINCQGTAMPIELLDIELPESIVLTASLGTKCYNCGYWVEYIKAEKKWIHINHECNSLRPVTRINKQLFDFLKELEGKYGNSNS